MIKELIFLLCHGHNKYFSFKQFLLKLAPSCEHVLGQIIFFPLLSIETKKDKIPLFSPIISPSLDSNNFFFQYQ